jgi:hypothetical protein
MGWAGHMARKGKRRGAYRVLRGKLKERGHLKDLGILEDNIKMDLPEIEYEGLEQSVLAQYMNIWRAVVNAVMNYLFSQNAGNFYNN